MATDMEASSQMSLPSLEGLTPTEVRSVILPYIIRFTTSTPAQEHPRDIVVLVDPTNRSFAFLESPINTEAIVEGPVPASKTSIEAMPMVNVLDEGTDCSICLLDFKIGGEVKEMPCRHHFHSICIDEWLGINGSCPICRYKMPVNEESENKSREDERDGDEIGDDGGRETEMEGDRVMFVFHVGVRRDTADMISISISNMEVQRYSNDVLIRAGDGDESEARDGDEFQAGDGGDAHESEAQDMVIDDN